MEVYTRLELPDLFLSNPFALAEAVTWLPGTDVHWAGGIQYDVACTDVAVTSMTCISGSPDTLTKSATFSLATRGSRPFTIYGEVDCTPDRRFWGEAEQQARNALTQSGPRQIEESFWSGASGGAPIFPNLSTTGPIFDNTNEILLQPSSTLISGTPLDLVEGVGRLESAFHGCYAGRGVLHVPAVLASEFGSRSLVSRGAGGALVTSAGNRVVFGSGYPTDIGPDGQAVPTGSAWIYMTSPVFGIRGPIRTFTREESFDRNVNTLKMIAEQTVVLGWECCLVGALVTVGGDVAGQPFSPLQAF